MAVFLSHEMLRNKPKCRVELHIHMEGVIRPETIWELMRKKQLELPGSGSLQSLKEFIVFQDSENTSHSLPPWTMYMPAFRGDLEAIERVCIELVEDLSRQSVAYCEARISPHMFLSTSPSSPENELLQTDEEIQDPKREVTVNNILDTVLEALRKGEERLGTKVRLIISCIKGKTDSWWEVLRLCEEYRDGGVVGMDVFLNEETEDSLNSEMKEVLEAAKAKGVPVTLHADDQGWEGISKAVTELGVNRIAHGYRVLENEDFYQKCLEEEVHFEMCSYSSCLKGAIQNIKTTRRQHPILRFAEDGGNFSISSDFPTNTGKWISDEYDLLQQWGMTEAHFVRANFQAAQSSFLPPEEKEELLSALRHAYGVILPPVKETQLPVLQSNTTRVSPAINGEKSTHSEVRPAIKIAPWEYR